MGKRNAKKVRTRAFLYSPERPGTGVLFQTEEAIAEALEQGWEESPGEAQAKAKAAAEQAKAEAEQAKAEAEAKAAAEAKAEADAKAKADADKAKAASKADGDNGNKSGGAKKVTAGDNS